MAIKPLNSVAGFSVGEVPKNIILANGDITTTNITTTGVSNLNSIGNVKISGGSSGQVIQTDGTGNLTFATLDSASLSNGNSNVRIFANSNVTVSVGGNANVATFTSTGFDVAGYIAGNDITADGNLSVNNYIITPSAKDLVVAPATQITRFSSNVNPFTGGYSLGNATARWDNVFSNTANVSGNIDAGGLLTDNLYYANGTPWDFAQPAGANTEIQYNDGAGGFGASNAFTFDYVGNALTVTGTANITGNLAAGNIDGGNLVTANNFATNGAGGDITLTGGNVLGANVVIANSFTSNGGTIDFATNNPNVRLGDASNVHILGGAAGQVLQTDGSGNLSWTSSANVNQIHNGDSNVTIPDLNGNVYINANAGVDQQWVFDVNGNLTAPAAGTANLGNLITANYANFANDIDVQGNIANANNISVTNNITAGSANVTNDLDVGGNIVTGTGSGGNISGVNVLSANVANISDVINTGKIANGTSNVRIDQNGNITISSNNASNVFTFSDVGANIVGYVTANGNGTFGALYSNTLTAQGGNLELRSEQAGDTYIQLRPYGNGTVDVGNVRITSLATPNASTDAATKQYVDDVAQGLNVHDSALAATANTLANLTGGVITYNNGTSGVGANLVLSGSPTLNYLSANVFDGNVTAVVGSRILVKSETNAAYNGIYVVDSSTVLTRASDYDTVPEVEAGDFIFVQDGTTYNDSGWVQTSVVTVIGTDPINFTQFSGAGTYQAGQGLTLTGTVFSVNVDNITTEISDGNVIVKANAQLTTPNIGAATGTSLDLTGNLTAGNVNSNAMITTVDLNATGNIVAANLTSNALTATRVTFAGTNGLLTDSSNFTWNDTTQVLSIGSGGTEIGGDSGNAYIQTGIGNFSGNINSLNANLGNLATANFIDVSSNITTSNLTVNLELSGNTANFSGNVISPSINANTSVIIGNSTITWATATTTSIGGNQTISSYTMTGSGVTGIEWIVKGVDDNLVAPKYSVVTVQAVTDGTDVDYTLFGGVYLGGTTGSIAVNIVGSAIELQVTPASSNSTVWTTQYRLI